MSKAAGVLAGLLVPAFLLAGAVAEPAVAQEKKADKKAERSVAGKANVRQLASDEKVRAYEVTYKPGNERSIQPGHRVVRALKGGTLERTHPDGKKEKVAWKPNQVRINKPTKPYSVKNVGQTEVQLYVVEAK